MSTLQPRRVLACVAVLKVLLFAEGYAVNTNYDVITAKDEYAQSSMGQREEVKFSDVKMINAFYNCARELESFS